MSDKATFAKRMADAKRRGAGTEMALAYEADAALAQLQQERDNLMDVDRKREAAFQRVIEQRTDAIRQLRVLQQERDTLREAAKRCAEAEAAITGTLLARMQDIEAAKLTVCLKKQVQDMAALATSQKGV